MTLDLPDRPLRLEPSMALCWGVAQQTDNSPKQAASAKNGRELSQLLAACRSSRGTRDLPLVPMPNFIYHL